MVTSAPQGSQPSHRLELVSPASRKRRSRRRWRWVAVILVVLAVAAYIEVRHVLSQAAPILRARVEDTLAARFKTKVELARIDVSLTSGVNVSGSGLNIYGPTDANPSQPGVQPVIALKEFDFHTGIFDLFRSPMHIDTIHVRGMVLNIPPKQDRSGAVQSGKRAKIRITVKQFICDDTQLVINTSKPGKQPFAIAISHLVLNDIGSGQPMLFDATLVNPKPTGNIKSQGKFGPFREDDPRETAVVGNYSFTHADLGTFKGISGILSSTGKFGGTLGKIEVAGATDTPDFRVATGHPVALHTDFHAIVDGTDGDTYLQPVEAHFLRSQFTARGKVVRAQNPQGHDVELDVTMDRARIEDLLTLGVKTDPPILSGDIRLKTHLSLPPGPENVMNRLKLDGTFHIPASRFSNPKIQDRIDSLSLRAQGKPGEAAGHDEPPVESEIDGEFHLKQGLFDFAALQFAVPGVHAQVNGQYSLDGNTFDFHGKLDLDAKLSQMTTGWKSALLKPIDPFFRKHGAGTEIPFRVSGTRSEPKIGLDFGHSRSNTQ
jgi:hypothetical protein